MVITAVQELAPRVKTPAVPVPIVDEMEQPAVVNFVTPVVNAPFTARFPWPVDPFEETRRLFVPDRVNSASGVPPLFL
jgi:hypothetical protein